jgi:surface polysaccharide O-acyltransferase-like enzyme
MNERKYFVDWMRVIAMLGVFLFHCSRLFDNEDWNIKATVAQQSGAVSVIRGTFVWTWLMEIFFLLAGFATWYALRNRTAGQFLLERVKRLLIPVYTVGLFIILVPQIYFGRFTHGMTSQTFWQWLPGYFLGLPKELLTSFNIVNPVGWMPLNDSGHLWFIMFLFFISVVSLPIIFYLKSEKGKRLVAMLAGWAIRPGGILLFALPLALVRVSLNWLPKYTDHNWTDFLWYLLYFVFGFIFAADDRFIASIKKHGWLCLALWLAPFIGIGGVLTFVLQINTDTGHGFSLAYVIWQITYALSSWASVVFLLSLGIKRLNYSNPFLTYANEAVLPFYILHQTIIQIVAFFVLPYQVNAYLEYFIIAAISFPLILLIYELLVRRFNLMRFLFGMNPVKKQPVVAPKVVPAG